MTCCAPCCCVTIKERDTINDWMLSTKASPPSLFQRLLLCQCSDEERQLSGIEKVPNIRGLAGVTLQYGDHATNGSLQTLRWAKWDPESRVAEMQVFGGFGGAANTGQWTEDPAKPSWLCLTNASRCTNYTYRFTFTEDYKRAQIDIRGNPLPLCCICVPCVPAWATVPRCCVGFSMRATEGVEDGTSWDRYNSILCMREKFYYHLVTVYDPDGAETSHTTKIAVAPKQVFISY